MVKEQQQFQKLIKQNQKSYYSLEKISLLKVRYGGEKLKLERPKSFFVSHRYKSCIFHVLVSKNLQITSNVTKCGKEFKQLKMLLLSESVKNSVSMNNIPSVQRKTKSL